MKYIDIHCHLNFSAYDNDKEETVRRSHEADIGMIVIGTQRDTSKKAVELAKNHAGVWAAVGLHPIHTSKSHHDEQELGEGGKVFTSRGEIPDIDFYETLARHPKTIAIGECGLDYFRSDPEDIEKQRKVFLQHIDLANKVNKPLMLHVRNGKDNSHAYKEAVDMLKKHTKVRSNFHFFAGTTEDLKLIFDINGTVSFTGVVTFARSYDEVIKYVPIDRIMSEIDAPFVAPIPYRGKRNEPLFIKEIVASLASIRGETVEKLSSQIIDNARKMFGI